MAEYHYKYDPPNRPKGSGEDELVSWIIIVLALAIFWPVGLFLLFRKLMSASTGTPQSGGRASSQSGQRYHYSYTYDPNQTQTQAQTQARTQAAQPQPPAAPVRQPRPVQAAAPQRTPKVTAGRGFIISGGILTGFFGSILLIVLADALASGALGNALAGLAALSCFTGIGLVLLYTGLFRRRRARTFRKYLALIGKRDTVSISTLAKATGKNYKKVCDDLQEMLDCGALPMGYLNLATDELVLTSQGIADEPEDEAEPEESPKDDNDILSEIRSVNNSIADPDMSAKIDRIGEITGKILDYQRSHPSKANQLRSFLSYYLPTTLKILRAYAQLEEQGIEGENISAAKKRIEDMMDQVVSGFEKQLDKLFQDDAMDITSDVEVLENMLKKDGLSDEGGITMTL